MQGPLPHGELTPDEPSVMDPFVHSVHPTPGSSTPAATEDDAYPPTEHSPAFLERLDVEQHASFLSPWRRLPPQIRDITFDLHGDSLTPQVINNLADVLHKY